jgi:hemolysin III
MQHQPVLHHLTGEFRSRWRGRIHALAMCAALPAGIALVVLAEGAAATTATSVYAASLVLLFGTSASYHMLARSRRAQLVMQRLDHSMVYVLIAGTYTPLCLVALPRVLGIVMLCVVWCVAAVGILLKSIWRARVFASVLYVALGWIVVFVLPWAYERIGLLALSLYAVGGTVFTVGAVMFYRRWPTLRPSQFGFHEVWHSLTVIAVALQFTATTLLVR